MKARSETLQPLIIYGNPLTPRTRREMSDLQHYSKLPPIRPDTTEPQDVGDGETSHVGDITLDLGDIDVACLTERNTVGDSGLEKEVVDDRLQIAYTPIDTTTNFPEAGTAASIGLDPSPRSGCQNPSLIHGLLPTSNSSEDADEARPLDTLEEAESPQSEIGDLQNNHAFTRHVSKKRVPLTAPGFNTSTSVGTMSSDDRRKDKNKANAILELSEDEDEVPERETIVEDQLEPADLSEKQQNNLEAPEIILTTPSVDIEGAHSLAAEQEKVLGPDARNGGVNTKLNEGCTDRDDVLTKADDVSRQNGDVSEEDDVSAKNYEVLPKDIVDTDDEYESSCDDEGVYTLDHLDCDDYDSDDNLLTLEEQEEQRLWDLEFEKRRDELVREQEKVETRRGNYLSKLKNLTDRWNGIEARLENRQVEQRHQLYEQLQQLVTLHKRN